MILTIGEIIEKNIYWSHCLPAFSMKAKAEFFHYPNGFSLPLQL